MDVYFERIAGVADTRPAPSPAAQAAPAPAAEPAAPAGLDENGFPLSPLSDQDQLWFVQASRLHRPLAASASLARSSGGLLMLSGGLAALLGALGLSSGGSPLTLVLGLVVGTLGMLDRGTAAAMSAADPAAPGKLARNQVILFALLAAGAWAAGLGRIPMPDPATLPPEVGGALANLPAELNVLPVVLLALLAVHAPLALYHLSRRRSIAEFHGELPPWVTRIVATLAGR